MAAMMPFLAMQWQVGVGVGGGCHWEGGGCHWEGGGLRENVKILGPSGCILDYFNWTFSVLIY